MPQYREVNKLYKLCVENVYKAIFRFCKELEKRTVRDKNSIIKRANLFFIENLPKRYVYSFQAIQKQ